jgi:hypothetical protein
VRHVDVLVVWHVDRLVRRLADIENVIERCEAAGVKLATVSGDLDLSTDAGRLVGRILASVARGEVERKSARQKAAAQQAARDGVPRLGCPRPFGYDDDRVTPHPVEGKAVAGACSALIAGSTLSAITREWQAAGLTPPQARYRPTRARWARHSVRTILLNPRIAGLASYRGEITGPGKWDALVAEDTWRRVVAILTDGARIPQRGVRTLLGGLARCTCGAPVVGSANQHGQRVYRCRDAREGGGPHVARLAAPADEFVADVTVARLSEPAAATRLIEPVRADVAALRAEATGLRRRLANLGRDYALGTITRPVLHAGTEAATARLEQIDGELADAGRTDVLAPLVAAESVQEAWETLDTPRRRAVIGRLMTITLHPVGRGARVFDPDTVSIEWVS